MENICLNKNLISEIPQFDNISKLFFCPISDITMKFNCTINNHSTFDFSEMYKIYRYLPFFDLCETKLSNITIFLYMFMMLDGMGDFSWLEYYLSIFKKYVISKVICAININIYSINDSLIKKFDIIKNKYVGNVHLANFCKYLALFNTNKKSLSLQKNQINVSNNSFNEILSSYTKFYESSIEKEDIIIDVKDKEFLLKFHKHIGMYFVKLYEIREKYSDIISYFVFLFEIDTFFGDCDTKSIFLNDHNTTSYNINLEETLFICFHDFLSTRVPVMLARLTNAKIIHTSEGAANIKKGDCVLPGIGTNMIGIKLLNPVKDIYPKEKIYEIIDKKINYYYFAYLGKKRVGECDLCGYDKLNQYINTIYELNYKSYSEPIHLLVNYDVFDEIKNNENFPQQCKKGIKEIKDNMIFIRYDNFEIIVHYYKFLEQKLFYTLIYYANNPVLMTGDLSVQEAISLGKYVIMDNIGHKQNMNKYLRFFLTDVPCNTWSLGLGNEIYDCNYYKNNNLDYDAIMKNKIDIIKKYFNFEHNFKILIFLIYNKILGEEFSKIPHLNENEVNISCYNTYNKSLIEKYNSILKEKLEELFLQHNTNIGGCMQKYLKYKKKNN